MNLAFVYVWAFIILCVLAGVAMAGCGGAKQVEGESLYATQQLACVEVSKTREAREQCKKRVQDAWATDGGAE